MVLKMKQETFTDMEYGCRKKKNKREELWEIMDEIIPWDEWAGVIEPYYLKVCRGRPPMGIEKMLRTYLIQILRTASPLCAARWSTRSEL